MDSFLGVSYNNKDYGMLGSTMGSLLTPPWTKTAENSEKQNALFPYVEGRASTLNLLQHEASELRCMTMIGPDVEVGASTGHGLGFKAARLVKYL